MDSTQYYLKPNVQIEPLVNQWHVYPFLIAPATAAMVTANYQITTMKSYLQMPMAHAAALKNPDMVGGAFIDYNGKRLGEIKALKEKIEDESRSLVELAKGIKELNDLLQNKAKGYPLEEMYPEVPAILRGYVELVYDLQNQPAVRFIEPLLYNSPFYRKAAQSIALTLINSDHRSFIFSTPRLKDARIVHLSLHFDDERLDDLVGLKTHPQPYAYIKEHFQVSDEDDEAFQSLLTEVTPKITARYDGEGVRVRYFGHACVLLESKDVSVLTDPLISYKYESDIVRYTYEDLPEQIDYVVITHAHHDHIVIETLLQLRSRIKNIIVPKGGNGFLQDPSMKLILQNIGFKSVIEIEDLETIRVPGAEITGVPFFGEHCDLSIRSKSAYAIRFAAQSFLMVADSSAINPDVYKNVKEKIGTIDTIFVGLECTGAPMSWSYGALLTQPLDRQLDQVRRSKGSNCKTALELVNIFEAKHVYLYAMGSEPWLNYFMALQHSHSEASGDESQKLLEECASRGIVGEKLFANKELLFEHHPTEAAISDFA
jgi:L-ascorbate metabolism protein UlaG (beta-lactamase superfamily)